PNPAGPGMHFEDLAHVFDQGHDGRRREIALGSHGVVDAGPARNRQTPCTWTLLVQSAVPEQSATVLAEEDGDSAITLSVGASGAEASVTWPNGSLSMATGVPLKPRRWYRLWLAIDPASGRVVLGQQGLDRQPPSVVEKRADGVRLPSSGTVLFAAERARAPHRHFTGKLEAPAILRGFVEAWPDPLAEPDAEVLAAWYFSQGISGSTITDTGPGKHHGRLVNQPTRAVVGARWGGT
ncbi:MAG: hypothetical protein ACREF3_17750, partial [Acetobacteraceae bacterium]